MTDTHHNSTGFCLRRKDVIASCFGYNGTRPTNECFIWKKVLRMNRDIWKTVEDKRQSINFTWYKEHDCDQTTNGSWPRIPKEANVTGPGRQTIDRMFQWASFPKCCSCSNWWLFYCVVDSDPHTTYSSMVFPFIVSIFEISQAEATSSSGRTVLQCSSLHGPIVTDTLFKIQAFRKMYKTNTIRFVGTTFYRAFTIPQGLCLLLLQQSRRQQWHLFDANVVGRGRGEHLFCVNILQFTQIIAKPWRSKCPSLWSKMALLTEEAAWSSLVRSHSC